MSKKRAQRNNTWKPSPQLLKELEQEGTLPGITQSAARFNGAMGRIFGTKHGPTPDENTIEFLKNFDSHMRELAKREGIELHDDEA